MIQEINIKCLFSKPRLHLFFISCKLKGKKKKKAHCIAMTMYANYRKLKQRDSPNYLGMI